MLFSQETGYKTKKTNKYLLPKPFAYSESSDTNIW